jgi:hypothetical protein
VCGPWNDIISLPKVEFQFIRVETIERLVYGRGVQLYTSVERDTHLGSKNLANTLEMCVPLVHWDNQPPYNYLLQF